MANHDVFSEPIHLRRLPLNIVYTYVSESEYSPK